MQSQQLELHMIEQINSAVRTLKVTPFLLSNRPGGFIGTLAQTRVAYDAVESGTWDTLGSGSTLLNNLNRIRYRLGVLESGGAGASSFLDLTDTPDVYTGSAGKAVVVNPTEDGLIFSTVAASGVDAGVSTQYEDLSAYLDGITTLFNLSFTPASGISSLHYNGLQQLYDTDYTLSGSQVSTNFTPFSGDSLTFTYFGTFETLAVSGITVSDGTNTYNDTTRITFSGAVVSDLGGGNSLVTISGVTQTYAVEVRRNANQSIGPSVDTEMSFDTEVNDSGDMFDIGTPTDVICRKAGWYVLAGGVGWEANTGNGRRMKIFVNSTEVSNASQAAPSTHNDPKLSCSIVTKLAENDVMTMVVRQVDPGENINCSGFFSAGFIGA